jgi:hypothetical protein
MNFNLTQSPDYRLQADMTHEMINLYGLNIKFLVVTKVNRDTTVFGDFSHIKIDNKKVFSLYAMAENTDEALNQNVAFTQFGYYTTASINLFISRKSMERIFPKIYDSKGIGDVIGNLIILPSGGVVEVTDCQFEVPGVSNLYANIDNKNVYRLTCITYNNKQQNEIDPINKTQSNFVTLENYFEELIAGNDSQDLEANYSHDEEPAVVADVDSVFGRF